MSKKHIMITYYYSGCIFHSGPQFTIMTVLRKTTSITDPGIIAGSVDLIPESIINVKTEINSFRCSLSNLIHYFTG